MNKHTLFSGLWPGQPLMLDPRALQWLTQLPTDLKSTQHAVKPFTERNVSTQEGIAVLPIHGPLCKRAGFWDALYGITAYEEISGVLESMLQDEHVQGILLDIDSPGGEAAGMFDLADQIYHARSIKPIWAIANDSAYSAAYALASAAEKVFLTCTGGVGSIGVIAVHMDQSAWDEQQGLKITPIYAGAHKNDYSAHHPLGEQAHISLQAEVNRLYGLFVALVARNRGLISSQVESTEAGLFFGEQALQIGLADGILALPEVLKQMASLIFTKKSPITQKEYKTMTQIEPLDITSDAEASPSVDLLIKQAEAKGRSAYRAEILELTKLCASAQMPEQLSAFIEQGISIATAREELLQRLVQKSNTSIQAHILPATHTNFQENPVVQAAKARFQRA